MDKNRQGAKASYVAFFVFVALWILAPSFVRMGTREAFVEFQAPALHLVAKGRDLARFWELKSKSSEELAAASRDLARINAALELKVRTLEDIRQENIRLRELARYTAPREFLTIVARVASRDSSSWWHRIILRKGRSDGIRPGCPVVFSDRVIGKVSLVHLNTCEVDLVTSPNFRCTAYLEGDEQGRIVLVSGLPANSLGTARAKIAVIPTDYIAPAGQSAKVVTTGMGGVFPAGLTIGTLDSNIRTTQEGNFKEGTLQPSRNLFSLQEVSVLVPIHPAAGEILLEKRYEDFQ